MAKRLVNAMRYNTNDYLWINDTHPKMIMHPIKPVLDGKDLSQFKDPNGKFLFVEFAKVAKQKGEGTVDYLWPKPGQDKPVPKLSYVKLYQPWGWIIGTGIYIDDADATISAKQAEVQSALSSQRNMMIGFFVIVLGLSAGLIAWIARRITAPIRNTGAMLKDIADGEGDLTRRLEVRTKDETGEMANGIKELAKQTASATEQIKTKIGGIQQTTGEAVTEISEISKIIHNINQVVGTIAAAVEEQSAATKEIADNVAQAARGYRKSMKMSHRAQKYPLVLPVRSKRSIIWRVRWPTAAPK